jgi:hypothetical protein
MGKPILRNPYRRLRALERRVKVLELAARAPASDKTRDGYQWASDPRSRIYDISALTAGLTSTQAELAAAGMSAVNFSANVSEHRPIAVRWRAWLAKRAPWIVAACAVWILLAVVCYVVA